MNCHKKFIIRNSPYANIYSELILENCLNDIKYNENENPIDIVFKNNDLTDILFNLIVYGNLNSKTNKSLNIHSRLNSFDEDDKHQMTIEIERCQRLQFYMHNIIFMSLFVCLFSMSYLFLK